MFLGNPCPPFPSGVCSCRSKSRNLVPDVCLKFGIQIEDKQLPVGDAIWIARHRRSKTEYVLDVIVERKNADDFRSSIRDNRYKDQKLRILTTGLKKMIYVVEGDPSALEAADSILTACFTTEIMEGFDVKRTNGLGDTLQLYGHLTLAITDYYKLNSSDDECRSGSPCPSYSEFIRIREDHEKLTVREVFGLQLMQDGDTRVQEELLMRKSKNGISAAASRNIFQTIWK